MIHSKTLVRAHLAKHKENKLPLPENFPDQPESGNLNSPRNMTLNGSFNPTFNSTRYGILKKSNFRFRWLIHEIHNFTWKRNTIFFNFSDMERWMEVLPEIWTIQKLKKLQPEKEILKIPRIVYLNPHPPMIMKSRENSKSNAQFVKKYLLWTTNPTENPSGIFHTKRNATSQKFLKSPGQKTSVTKLKINFTNFFFRFLYRLFGLFCVSKSETRT